MPEPKSFGKVHMEVEQKLLHLMLEYPSAVEEAMSRGVTADMFDPHHANLVLAIYREYERTEGHALTREAYRELLVEQSKEGLIKAKEISPRMSVYDKARISTTADRDEIYHLLRSLREACVAREFPVLLQKVNKNIEDKGFLYAVSELSEEIERLLALTETRTTRLVSLDEIKDEYINKLDDLRKNPRQLVRSHFSELDSAINVGFLPQGLTLFVADVGGYKTTTMLNVALNIYEFDNKPVMFIPLEQGWFEITNKLVSNRAKIHADRLARPEFLTDEDMEKIKQVKLWMKNSYKFCVLDTDERISPSALRAEIKKHLNYFRPAVVVIDYIANLRSDRQFERHDLEIGEILKDLRFMGKKFGFHVISAAQMGRDTIKRLRKEEDAVPDSTAPRGSHEYSADADNIIALLPADEPDIINCYVIKARYGKKGVTFTLRVDGGYSKVSSTDLKSHIVDPTTNSLDDIHDLINTPASKIEEEIENDLEFGAMGVEDNLADELEGVGA